MKREKAIAAEKILFLRAQDSCLRIHSRPHKDGCLEWGARGCIKLNAYRAYNPWATRRNAEQDQLPEDSGFVTKSGGQTLKVRVHVKFSCAAAHPSV